MRVMSEREGRGVEEGYLSVDRESEESTVKSKEFNIITISSLNYYHYSNFI